MQSHCVNGSAIRSVFVNDVITVDRTEYTNGQYNTNADCDVRDKCSHCIVRGGIDERRKFCDERIKTWRNLNCGLAIRTIAQDVSDWKLENNIDLGEN